MITINQYQGSSYVEIGRVDGKTVTSGSNEIKALLASLEWNDESELYNRLDGPIFMAARPNEPEDGESESGNGDGDGDSGELDGGSD